MLSLMGAVRTATAALHRLQEDYWLPRLANDHPSLASLPSPIPGARAVAASAVLGPGARGQHVMRTVMLQYEFTLRGD